MNGRLFIARRVGIQNDHMERAVHPATIGKALIDLQIIIRQPFFFGIFPIFERYRTSFSKTFLPQLQLWHFHWLVSVGLWASWIYKFLRFYHSCVTQTLLQSSKHISFWMISTRLTSNELQCVSVPAELLQASRVKTMSQDS